MFYEPCLPMNHLTWDSKFQTGIKRGKTGWYAQHQTNQTAPTSLGNHAELCLLRLLFKEKGSAGVLRSSHASTEACGQEGRHSSLRRARAQGGSSEHVLTGCWGSAAVHPVCSLAVRGIWQLVQRASCPRHVPSQPVTALVGTCWHPLEAAAGTAFNKGAPTTCSNPSRRQRSPPANLLLRKDEAWSRPFPAPLKESHRPQLTRILPWSQQKRHDFYVTRELPHLFLSCENMTAHYLPGHLVSQQNAGTLQMEVASCNASFSC